MLLHKTHHRLEDMPTKILTKYAEGIKFASFYASAELDIVVTQHISEGVALVHQKKSIQLSPDGEWAVCLDHKNAYQRVSIYMTYQRTKVDLEIFLLK